MIYYVAFLIPLLIWGWFIRRYDKYEPEPLFTMLLIGVAGGVLSVLPAGSLNTLVGFLLQADIHADSAINPWKSAIFAIFIGFNEEFLKAFVTFYLIRKNKHFTEPIDALIYAMTVGLGFAFIENISYTEIYGPTALIVRQFNAVPLHVGLAAMWGVGIAKTKFGGSNKLSQVLPFLLMPSLVHAGYDFFLFLSADEGINLVVSVIIAVGVIILAHKKLKSYQKRNIFDFACCKKCKNIVPQPAAFCTNCGSPFIEKIPGQCRNCGNINPTGSLYCVRCGGKL